MEAGLRHHGDAVLTVWEQPAAPFPAYLTMLQAAPSKGPHRVL